MSGTEYLWLEERVQISDSVPREKSEWSTWPGKCWFHHHGDLGSDVKQFIQELQGPIFPPEEKLVKNLEEILCCCGNRATQKANTAGQYGYTTGSNLPRITHEDRQSSLIEYFHNIFNHLITSENQPDEVKMNHLLKIRKFLDETLQDYRYRIYNPSSVRLLHILRQYLQMPFVQHTELPMPDFMRLVEGPLWEECAQKLKTKYSSKVYVDLHTQVTNDGKIGIYIEGPSLHEIKSVKTDILKYIDLTINPPKPKEKEKKKDEKKNEEIKNNEEKKNETEKTKEDKDQNQPVSNDAEIKKENEEDTAEYAKPSQKDESPAETENKEKVPDDIKRDSKSADRYVANQTDKMTMKELFTRSKSVPANSATENREPEMRSAKRAKYDSECSNNNIIEPNPTEELTLFKETLSLILMERLENNNELINLSTN